VGVEFPVRSFCPHRRYDLRVKTDHAVEE
jgi:hypothetical protein